MKRRLLDKLYYKRKKKLQRGIELQVNLDPYIVMYRIYYIIHLIVANKSVLVYSIKWYFIRFVLTLSYRLKICLLVLANKSNRCVLLIDLEEQSEELPNCEQQKLIARLQQFITKYDAAKAIYSTYCSMLNILRKVNLQFYITLNKQVRSSL